MEWPGRPQEFRHHSYGAQSPVGGINKRIYLTLIELM